MAGEKHRRTTSALADRDTIGNSAAELKVTKAGSGASGLDSRKSHPAANDALAGAGRGRPRPPAEPQPQSRQAPRCDKIDRRLINLLIEDVHASNKELAEKVGLSVWTVASRLERLRADNLLAATVVVDWQRAGYALCAFAFVRVQNDQIAAVARIARNSSWLQAASRAMGTGDFFLQLLARDQDELRRMIDRIRDLPGVVSTKLNIITEYHGFSLRRMRLPMPPWTLSELPNPIIPLDELDRELVARLVEDGHQSNRELARQLNVSDSTVGARVRRLEESKLFRVVAIADPFALGEATSAMLALETGGAQRAAIVRRLLRRTDLSILATCVGAHDLVAATMNETHEQLLRALDEIGAEEGVRSMTVVPTGEILKYRVHLVRLLP